MKIPTKRLSYEQAMHRKKPKHRKPLRPFWLLQWIIRLISGASLKRVNFKFRKHRMERLGKKEPCLILMNHSGFIDMKIASRIFFPKRYGIVCTEDSFVGFGKPLLMRLLGCIPTKKFTSDVQLIKDMRYMLKKKRCSVLMFPEASYSFDGTATPLPRKMGILLKRLDVPVVTVITKGAFARDPLYNCLQKRKVDVRADATCLLTVQEIRTKTIAELDQILDEAFSFDNFDWQQRSRTVIDEPYRADGLNRILYRCPHCGKEGKTIGKGVTLTCRNCGYTYELTETGWLKCLSGNAAFTHIPNWYAWERGQVRHELEKGTYRMQADVDIGVMVDYKAIYMVGKGKLTHDTDGFRLTGCSGKLNYVQGPLASYSLYSDYYWYEIGDVICIGNRDVQYYCFPKNCGDVVAKTRLATEELYKLKKSSRMEEDGYIQETFFV